MAVDETPCFQLGALNVPRGERHSGFVSIPDGRLTGNVPDSWKRIPITVAHGAQPGPVLLLIAGIHGTEYVPIVALQRLRQELDPATLSGTVIMVHIANMGSFLRRTPFGSPDGLNLNRQFPGDIHGSLTERIAAVLDRDLIPLADAVVDIHGGDVSEEMAPWVGYYDRIGDAPLRTASRQMAMAFGAPLVVKFPFNPTPAQPCRYTGPAALRRRIPSFDVEAGCMMQAQPEFVDLVVRGLHNLLRHLGMEAGPVVAPAVAPRLVGARDYLEASTDGIFCPAPDAIVGQSIAAGAVLGCVRDPFGVVVEEFRAPQSGYLLLRCAGPAVNAGETVAVIAHLEDE